MDPEEQAATLARKQQQHRERSVLWFRGQAQKRLMHLYLEVQLRANHSHERSVAQQLSHFRRLANESTILEMEQYVCPQLEPTSSHNLREDLHALRCLLSGPVLPNDLDWIIAAGGEHCPPKRLLVQQLQRLVTPRLEATLRFPHTRDYAQDLMERCALGFYQDLLLTAWPLLDSSSQRSLQAWFLRCEMGLRDEDHQPATAGTAAATTRWERGRDGAACPGDFLKFLDVRHSGQSQIRPPSESQCPYMCARFLGQAALVPSPGAWGMICYSPFHLMRPMQT